MSPPFPPPAPVRDERDAIVFIEALRKTLDDSRPFLAEACGTETGLRAEVEALLRNHKSAGSFLSGDSPLLREPGMELPRPEAGAARQTDQSLCAGSLRGRQPD